MSDVQIHPAWKHAAEIIAANPPEAGAMLPKEYLAKLMSIQMPTPATPYGEAKALELKALGHFDELRWWLMKEYQIRIEARGQKGYQVLAASECTEASMARRMRAIRREMKNFKREMAHIPYHELTQEQARAAHDAIAAVSRLQSQAPRRSPGGWLLKDEPRRAIGQAPMKRVEDAA